MGKLFWRMFLGLWMGSALLMVGTSILIATTVERRLPEGARGNIDRFATAAARSALAVFETGSAEDASGLLDNLERIHGLRMHFIDERGKEVLNRKLPSTRSTGRQRNDASDQESATPSSRRPDRTLDIPIVTSSGRKYRALITFNRPPRPPAEFILATLAWPVLISILLAGIISAVAAHYLVKPLAKLQAAAQRLASGELDYRVGNALDSRRDEFTALGKDFDRMADQIGQLLSSQKLLMLDLSHELRSPLARIKVALELARGKSAPADLIDRMDRDADRMDSMIGALLLLARLESPSSLCNEEEIDLSELIAAIVEDAQLEGAGSAHCIHARIAPGLAVIGDRELLSRAIENVLRNALRHTPDGSDIEVVASEKGDHVAIGVADGGKGIPPELIEHLFTPFARGEDASREGAGLGLAIMRAAIVRHGGTVAMKNRESGSGLEVLIRLPARKFV